MPNFWTKTFQNVDEKINGPRTKDTEFNIKVEEFKLVEKGLNQMRSIFQNFLTYSVSMKSLFVDVCTTIKLCYNNTSPFSNISENIYKVHSEMEKLFEIFYTNCSSLYSRTSSWQDLFGKPKDFILQRDKKRKIYDHYDEKMEKLYKSKVDKTKKNGNTSENLKESDYYKRNYEKYQRSAKEYIEISEKTYELIDNILEKRFELMNPIISTFINEERKFFTDCALLFKKLENVENQFEIIQKNRLKKEITYSPFKYIKGAEDLRKISEQEALKSKDTEEEYPIHRRSKSLHDIMVNPIADSNEIYELCDIDLGNNDITRNRKAAKVIKMHNKEEKSFEEIGFENVFSDDVKREKFYTVYSNNNK